MNRELCVHLLCYRDRSYFGGTVAIFLLLVLFYNHNKYRGNRNFDPEPDLMRFVEMKKQNGYKSYVGRET